VGMNRDAFQIQGVSPVRNVILFVLEHMTVSLSLIVELSLMVA
jgi:hypothetical protein